MLTENLLCGPGLIGLKEIASQKCRLLGEQFKLDCIKISISNFLNVNFFIPKIYILRVYILIDGVVSIR